MRITPRKPHWIIALLTLASISAASLQAAPRQQDRARLSLLDGNRPLAFEENRGQTDPQVKYLARGNGSTLFLTPSEAVLALRGSALRIRWTGGAPATRITAEGRLPGVTNHLTGRDPARWRTGVPSWTRVRYDEVWPGIDLVFYGNPRQLEHDVIVAPGADPRRPRLVFEGADELRIDPAGDLVAHVGTDEVRLRRPVSYQEAGGARREVESAWRILPGGRDAGFRIGVYDSTRPLVIDPVLVYSTYLGGRGYDEAEALVVDPAGNAYVTGITGSSDFPITSGVVQDYRLGSDAFVTKLDPEGRLVFSTYLGGSSLEVATGIAQDSAGDIYVAGYTFSDDFPGAGTRPGGDNDVFVAKLEATGSELLFARYLGGSNSDIATDIDVDAQGRAVVVGNTESTNFTTVRPLFASYGGGLADAFAALLSADGTALVYSTFLGGSGLDLATAVVVDAAGNAHVTGVTTSDNFPRVNGLPVPRRWEDAFVSKIDPTGSSLVFSTLLGGGGTDQGQGITLDSSGRVWVTGSTSSGDFPVARALQPFLGGGPDAFLSGFGPTGTLLSSTYLGGSAEDWGWDVAAGPSGDLFLTGLTSSTNFPLRGPIQAACAPVTGPGQCDEDAFVVRLDPRGPALVFSTYLGGSINAEAGGGVPRAYDLGKAIDLDAREDAYITGYTRTSDFPTENALLPAYGGGGGDGFVARIAFDSNQPPVCSAAVVSPALLWPPNGKLAPVRIGGLTDPDGDPVTISVTAIRQDEPLSKKGQPDATGLGSSFPVLRASRAGNGDGRVYHITFTATAPHDGSCTGTVTVCVPHDQRGRGCNDGGSLVDSTGER